MMRSTLVERSLAANPDIAAADATLRQMQELARAQVGNLLPQVDAGYQATRCGPATRLPGLGRSRM
jgi:outer membrane protein TolC